MAGSCFKDRGNNATWVKELGKKYLDDPQDVESVCDDKSEYSFATNASNPVDTPDVRDRVRKLFDSQSFTDVTFYPKDNRRESISAHRALLAISSPLFSKMLYDRKNNVGVDEKLQIQISNVSFEAFTRIVKYLYTDEIYFDNDALVQGILDGANQFSIHSLVNKCNEYFQNVELTSENVTLKLETSISNKITALKDRCIEFIQRNTLPVIQSPDFQNCNVTTVRTICKLQSFNLRSEMELFEAVMKWLQVRPHHERKSVTESLLKCIRLLNLTVEEFSGMLKKYSDIMTAPEGLSIVLCLCNSPKNPDFKSLPAWCNKNMENRCFPKGNQESDTGDSKDGRIIFPLKSDPGQGFISDLTSLLQMKCISGFHQVKAIKLKFERPLSDRCRITSILIKVHVSPCGLNFTKQVQIANSESMRVEFNKKIKLRRGDTLDIEVEAKHIELYKFLHFDDTGRAPSNHHFNIYICSFPKQDKLYFISEIEYEPQERFFNEQFKRRNFKNKTA